MRVSRVPPRYLPGELPHPPPEVPPPAYRAILPRPLAPEVQAARADAWVVHLVAASDVVYSELDHAIRWLESCGCTELRKFDTRGTQALGYVRDEFRCVVFRGTQEMEDWITDLLSFYCGSPPVHYGFQRSWNHVKEEVFEWLKNTSSASEGVYFAGHSLGGAIATIGAYEWTAQGCKVEQVITFGSPCPGSWEFAVRYERAGLSAKTKRYKHNQDGICVIPPPILFSHVAPPIELPNQAISTPKSPFTGFPPGRAASAPGIFDTIVNTSRPILLGLAPTAGAVLSLLDDKSASVWQNPKRVALKRWTPNGAHFLFFVLPVAVQLIVSASVVAEWLRGHANSILTGAGAVMACSIGTLLGWVLIGLVTLRGEVTSARTAIWAVLSIGAAIGIIWSVSASAFILSLSAKATWLIAIAAGLFVTQQAAFLLLIRVPTILRLALSCLAAIGAFWFSAQIPVNGFLTLAVVLIGLLMILVYRFAAGAPDHSMQLYLMAITGTGYPSPRDEANEPPRR